MTQIFHVYPVSWCGLNFYEHIQKNKFNLDLFIRLSISLIRANKNDYTTCMGQANIVKSNK